MSGSSLDGLDLALCTFDLDPEADRPVVSWTIESGTTVPYDAPWRARLQQSTGLGPLELLELHADLGDLIGGRCADFLQGRSRPFLAGCHGHTVHHEPARGFSVQLGHGARIASRLGLPVVTDLRSGDIAAGGEGAPLAPVADLHLFPEHRAFLNLGGIANYSFRGPDGKIVAGDVSGCCQILDRLAGLAGEDYDANGSLARSGKLLPDLMESLDRMPYHRQPYPKSLSNRWVVEELWPVLERHPGSVADRLHTFAAWLGHTIGGELWRHYEETGTTGQTEVLVSGGGTHNSFLMDQLRDSQEDGGSLTFRAAAGLSTDFKEAALIALCALLRWYGIPNSLGSATGASRDTINGAVYAP